MIEVDTGILAIIITVLLALLGLAAAWGALTQRVNNQDAKIEQNQALASKDIERLHIENREDHKMIFGQLREMSEILNKDKN